MGLNTNSGIPIMCGFAGFFSKAEVDANTAQFIGYQMGQAILHRGPDDGGVWQDESAGIALSHRRLSILDLSPAGHQPMVSMSGRYVIVFNGEIYNHVELRTQLEKCAPQQLNWRGHSDTETLLAAIEAWGLEPTLRESVGMFALGLWDCLEKVLYLARDRMGEKPLYYGWQGQGQHAVFLFGSELKALKAHPAFWGQIDRNAISLQLRYSYVPAPYSIYEGIHKLPPGSFIKLPIGDWRLFSGVTMPEPQHYWSFRQVFANGLSAPFSGKDAEAINALDSVLLDAVRQQMIADVPLGAFLSGGIDSSTIVALMQSQSSKPVKTFSIGFNEAQYNEAKYAAEVARYLGTEHTDLYVSSRQALDVIPLLPTLYDEPFSDPSQIPTYLLSKMTRTHVTVSLSGDAGDELFGGYTRYGQADRLWRILGRIPQSVRAASAKAICTLFPSNWNRLTTPFSPLLPANLRNIGDKAHKLAELLSYKDRLSFYRSFVAYWERPETLVIGGNEHRNYFAENLNPAEVKTYYDSMMLVDSLTYLPDDILVKVDRAAMGVSLETRVPLLDHRVVEFASRIPLNMKVRNGQGKWILRQVLYKYVPKDLIERPKMGFGIPINDWLRGSMRDWAENLLSESRLKREGYFNPGPIVQKWQEHTSGKRNWGYHLWNILMFQSWLEAQ